MTEHGPLLDELRPVSFAIVYRMLGSVSEAEDIVQDVLLRVHQTLESGEEIISPRGFVTTLKCIVNPDKLAHLGPVADLRSLLMGASGRSPYGVTAVDAES